MIIYLLSFQYYLPFIKGSLEKTFDKQLKLHTIDTKLCYCNLTEIFVFKKKKNKAKLLKSITFSFVFQGEKSSQNMLTL